MGAVNKMPFISVIVPVYNSELTLSRCVDSILNQTCCDFELILIDDGSTDDSSVICDKYRENDSRVKVIHQINSGAGAARNNGVEIAKGEYIAFIDSDDWIDVDLFEQLKLCCNNQDIIMFGFRRIDSYKTFGKVEFTTQGNYIITKSDSDFIVLLDLMKSAKFGYMCNKLYRRSLTKQTRIKNIRIGEDMCFCLDVFDRSSSILCTNICGYNYYYNLHSLVNSGNIVNILDIDVYEERIRQGLSQISKKNNDLIYNALMSVYMLDILMRDIIKNDSLSEKERRMYFFRVSNKRKIWMNLDLRYAENKLMFLVEMLEKIKAYHICYELLKIVGR